MRHAVTLITATAMAFALSACDVRRTGGEEEQAPPADNQPTAEPSATATAMASPTPSTSPVASIIRDESDPGTAAMALPTQPVEVTITFADSADLSPAAEQRLAALLSEGALEEDWPVVLRGHSASGGNDQANLRESRSRAEAVAAWLVENGVADERIEIVAFGEQNPIAPNALPDGTPDEAGRRANRRVEISITPPEPAAPAKPSPRWFGVGR